MSLETRRLKLQTELEEILGSRNVYFQPPSSISLSYPCIIYTYDDYYKTYADGLSYKSTDKYSIILITKDPLPEELLDRLNSMDYTIFDRHYSSDNLHHFAFSRRVIERI